MKFACESCQTRYTIPDEKVRGKVLKIRCKKCGSVITVKEEVSSPPAPEAPPIEERTRVADIGLLEKLRQADHARDNPSPAAPQPAPEPPDPQSVPIEWFAMVGGEQVGPLSPDELGARIASGEISDRSHVWRDGMGDWKRAGEVGELAGHFAPAPAPRPPSAPPNLPRARPPEDDAPTVARSRPDLAKLLEDPAPQVADPEPATALSRAFDDEPPARANAAAAPSNNLADLLGDIGEDDDGEEQTGAGPINVPATAADPFAQVPDSPSMAAPVIGEQTRFFMKKAGVTNRNPWWKYVIFALVLLGLPVAAIYGLGKAGVGGTVLVVDASTGQEKEVQRFSFEAIKTNGLGALLSGNAAPAPKPVAKRAPRAARPTKLVDPHAGDGPKANLTPEQQKLIAANSGLITGDPTNNPGLAGPIERKNTKTEQTDQGSAGLSDKVVAKVVGENAPSFNKCVEDKLKRDPSWKGGKINLSVTIGPSGTVLKSTIDKSDVAHSDVGDCLTTRIKRMHFPRFSGDEPQEIQFPLLLTNGG